MVSDRALRAQTVVPPRYELGEVPDQTVWSGSSRRFLVHSAGAPLTLTASPQPQGVLTLEPHLESDWLFRYLPALADRSSFNVTISGGGRSQSFAVTPQPSLPPEVSVFQTDQHTQPLISTHEVNVFDQASLFPENLNYTNRIVHEIRIVGDTVELEEDHENGLYEAYGNGDRRDIKSMNIIAERVIVRSPVRLKQTAVTIWARELVFEGEGRIQTTPEERLQSPGVGVAGVNGLPAGAITLHIGTLTSDTAGLNFDLSGGRGQPGGRGQHGSPGSSVTSLGSSMEVCDTFCKTHRAASGAAITYWYYTFAGATVGEGGTKTRPGNGSHARPSGKPGEGGAGGTLKSAIDVSEAFTNGGGASAAPSVPTTFPFDRFRGGAAGSPNKSEHVHFYVEFFSMKSTAATHTSRRGNDAELRRAATVAGSFPLLLV